MIVDEPPYSLVVVFADSDAQQFCQRLIERGQERRCLAAFRWRSIRDPLRDTLVHDPLTAVGPHLSRCERFLLACDHQGSGRESTAPHLLEAAIEAAIQPQLRLGQEAIACVFAPLLEELLIPTWERVKEILATKRARPAPSDDEVLAQLRRNEGKQLTQGIATVLDERPKSVLAALLQLLHLRHNAPLFEELGRQLSARRLKQRRSLARIMTTLMRWFPGEADAPDC